MDSPAPVHWQDLRKGEGLGKRYAGPYSQRGVMKGTRTEEAVQFTARFRKQGRHKGR